MTVTSIDSTLGGSNVTGLQDKAQQFKADFEKLKDALKSSDLAGAQQAFKALQQDAPAGGKNNPLQSQIDALGKALQSGDLAGAQKAFAALQSAIKANGPRGGGQAGGPAGGGRGGAGGADGSSSSSSTKTIVSE